MKKSTPCYVWSAITLALLFASNLTFSQQANVTKIKSLPEKEYNSLIALYQHLLNSDHKKTVMKHVYF
ncbi:MAG: hypothetical protein M9933_18995 [Chitinophagaceae bacterium]|nr:hypothetical protein [Chitinophagaceae bacterium]